jgi:DNA-binding NarL/FixJ family response regulator
MNPLEITLIIVGIIIIITSCILVDRSQKTTSLSDGRILSVESSLTQEDKKQLLEKFNEMVSEVSEETIIKTDDALSKISNEKIMAVNEFSDQIMEKINRNHEEVVFLYNMLNDKEKELKKAVKEFDSFSKMEQGILEKGKDNQVMKPEKKSTAAKAVTQAAQIERPISSNSIAETSQEPLATNNVSSNSNKQILSLHAQGKSVMEISKLLGLGQGEVKLVIDLFKGKK